MPDALFATAPTDAGRIPVLDIGPYLAGEADALQPLAAAIARTCEDTGFLVVANHGVPQQLPARVFAEAARFWYQRTLTMRHPERGIAGYAAWMPGTAGNKDGWVDDSGLLMGVAGIALALLAATTPVEPAWDRMLLISVPPRSVTA